MEGDEWRWICCARESRSAGATPCCLGVTTVRGNGTNSRLCLWSLPCLVPELGQH